VRFFPTAGSINLLTEAQTGLRLSILEHLAQMELLIIEEFGYCHSRKREPNSSSRWWPRAKNGGRSS
jgi:hypothetical protein